MRTLSRKIIKFIKFINLLKLIYQSYSIFSNRYAVLLKRVPGSTRFDDLFFKYIVVEMVQ